MADSLKEVCLLPDFFPNGTFSATENGGLQFSAVIPCDNELPNGEFKMEGTLPACRLCPLAPERLSVEAGGCRKAILLEIASNGIVYKGQLAPGRATLKVELS